MTDSFIADKEAKERINRLAAEKDNENKSPTRESAKKQLAKAGKELANKLDDMNEFISGSRGNGVSKSLKTMSNIAQKL